MPLCIALVQLHGSRATSIVSNVVQQMCEAKIACAIALISVWRLNHDLEESTNHHAGITHCVIIDM